MIEELRDADLARDWVAAGLQLVRVGPEGVAGFQSASRAVRVAASECARLPPVGILVDLGRLFEGSEVKSGPAPRALAAVLRRYDDQFLGRVAVHPRCEELRDALSGLPEGLRAIAVALVVEALLARVGFEAIVALAPEAIEDLDREDAGTWVLRGAAAVRTGTGDMLAEAYRQLLECFSRTADALMASEVTLVQRLADLRGRAERLALIQLVEAAAKLREGLPRAVRAGRRHAGHVATITEDESTYPVGGFSSITTRGSLENLLPSELAGMEDGPEIDLFDVRYAENELLYYTRDESSFVRSRRHVFVVLHAELDALRHRDPRLPWQVRILVLGLVRALVLQLERWLSTRDLHLHIVWPTNGLTEDRRILGVALQQQIHGGWVRFEEHDRAAMLHAARRAPTDVIHVMAEGGSSTPVEKTWTTVLCVHPELALTLPRGSVAVADDPWEAWRSMFETLARDLV